MEKSKLGERLDDLLKIIDWHLELKDARTDYEQEVAQETLDMLKSIFIDDWLKGEMK